MSSGSATAAPASISSDLYVVCSRFNASAMYLRSQPLTLRLTWYDGTYDVAYGNEEIEFGVDAQFISAVH